MPVGGGGEVGTTLKKGESAVLNVESGSALYSYYPKGARNLLGQYMKDNYKDWMKEKACTGLKSDELVLVTGTTMTKNWEAATFKTASSSVGVKLTVDIPGVSKGSAKINWRRRTHDLHGFQSGHNHIDDIGNGRASAPLDKSFDTCCHCANSRANQCIFLHGWRVVEVQRLVKLAYAMPVEAKDSVHWRTLASDSLKKLFPSGSSGSGGQTDSKDIPKSGPSSESDQLELELELSDIGSTPEEEDIPVCLVSHLT